MQNNESRMRIDSEVTVLDIDVDSTNIDISTIDDENSVNLVNSELIYGDNVEIEQNGDHLYIKQKYDNTTVSHFNRIFFNRIFNRGNNVIKIQSNTNCVVINNGVRIFSSNNESKDILKMVLVKDNNYNIMIKCESGKINIDNLVSKELSIDTLSGDIVVDGIKASKLDIQIVSGDASLYNVDVCDTNLESVSGDFKIELLESNANYLTRLSTLSGVCKQSALEVEDYETSDRRKLSVDTVSGDIKVLYKGRKK